MARSYFVHCIGQPSSHEEYSNTKTLLLQGRLEKEDLNRAEGHKPVYKTSVVLQPRNFTRNKGTELPPTHTLLGVILAFPWNKGPAELRTQLQSE